MARASLFRPAEIPEPAWFTRYNFHPEERLELLGRLLQGGAGEPSVALLSGEDGSGRRYLVEAAAFRFREPGAPVHVLTIDLEGYDEENDLGAYLEHQAAGRRDAGEEARRAVREALAEVGKRGARLSSAPLAVVLSLALQVAKPVRTLLRALDDSPPTVDGPRYLPQEIFAAILRALDGRVLVHVVDAEHLPRVRSGSSPWRWLAEVVERTPGTVLAVSCRRPEEVEAVLPSLEHGVETLEVEPLTAGEIREILDLRYAPHALPESLATALADYARGSGSAVLPGLVARGVVRLRQLGGIDQDGDGRWLMERKAASEALAEGLWERLSRFLYGLAEQRTRLLRAFLLDAALCGDLVPTRHLVELRASDADTAPAAAEDLDDLVTAGLVDELGLFDHLEDGLGTFPPEAAVHRFRDPLLRRVILDRADAGDRQERARAVSRFLEQRLPARSRDVARLYLHLAEHLGESERERWRKTLAWWIGVDEAEALRNEVTRQLRAGELAPEVVWWVGVESKELWPAYRRLAVLDAFAAGNGVPLSARGRFLYERGRSLLDLGRVHEALAHAEEAEGLLREQEGRESLTSVEVLDLWGRAAHGADELDLAKSKLEESVAIARRLLGDEDSNTLRKRQNLAVVYRTRGDLDAARAEYEAIVEVQHRILGGEHPLTLMTLSNLVAPLYAQGHLQMARALCTRVLAVADRVLGEGDPTTLGTRHNLAMVLQAQGDLEGARVEVETVLDVERRVLGEEHPTTLATRHSLAGLLQAQGDPEAARAEYERALEAARRVLGEEHRATLQIRASLAGLLFARGHLTRARSEYQRALDGELRVLGPENPETLKTRHNLAGVLEEQGHLVAADAELRRLLEVERRVLGDRHGLTLATRVSLARVLEARGDAAAARTEYARAITAGEGSPSGMKRLMQQARAGLERLGAPRPDA